MRYIGKAAAALAAVGIMAISTAPAQAQSCKANCNVTYQTCQRGGGGDACLKRWMGCKKKCNPAKAMSPAPKTAPRR